MSIIFGCSVLLMIVAILSVLISWNGKIALWMAKKFFAPMVLGVVGIKLDIKGAENIDYSKPNIFIANHESVIDIPIAIHALDASLYFVAKEELRKVVFLGWYISLVGMIFIKRGGGKLALESMKKAGKLIRNGKSVVLFPEGTRSKTGYIGMFKRGTFHLAVESEMDIIPMSFSGAAELVPRNIMDIKPGVVKVRIGKPIPTSNFTREEVPELTLLAEKAVKDLQCV